jgi:transcriptional regulator with XRE-family HTH domain
MGTRVARENASVAPGSILQRGTQYHTLKTRLYTSGVAEKFGERLRSLRTRKHFTPSALAHAVGVTEGAIRQMESGQTKSASFLVGLKLSLVLGVSPWVLATGRDAPLETESPGRDREPVALLERLSVQISAIDRRVKALEARRRAGTRRKAQE